MTEVFIVDQLIEWGLTPQIIILAGLLLKNLSNQNKIIIGLSQTVLSLNERLLILETKEDLK